MAKETFTKPKTETVSKKDTQKPFVKNGSQFVAKKETQTVLLATRNTQLPDGTFVSEGKEVVVASSYAKKVLKEANTPFKLITK